MKKEYKKISLRGIEHAGADTVVPDGGLEECIGLRHKNDSLVPFIPTKVGEHDIDTASNPIQIRVHKTSYGENILALYESGNLYWTSRQNFNNKVPMTRLMRGVKHFEFVGNMLVNQDLNSVVFDGEKYREIGMNVKKEELPVVSLRVRDDYEWSGESRYDSIGQGSRVFCYTKGYNWWSEQSIDNQRDKYNNDIMNGNKDIALSTAIKAKKLFTEQGALTGYAFAIVAYKLVNGSYVCASNPILLGEPTRMFKDGTCRTEYDTINTKSGNVMCIPTDFISRDIVFVKDTNYIINSNYDYYDNVIGRIITPAYNQDDDEHDTYNSSALRLKPYQSLYDNGYYDFRAAFCKGGQYAVKRIGTDQGNNDNDKFKYAIYRNAQTEQLSGFAYHDQNDNNEEQNILAVSIGGNILEYKIETSLNEKYKDVVDSLCIFLSQEVFGYELDSREHVVFSDKIRFNKRTSEFEGNGISFARKSNEDIIKELKKKNLFYEVVSIPFEEITAGQWEKANLRGKLGDNLLVQKALDIQALDASLYSDCSLFAYNSRLHIFDYIHTLSLQTVIQGYKYHHGHGQYAASSLSDIRKWKLVAHCYSNEYGNYLQETAGTLTEDSFPLNPLIHYPNKDCFRLDIIFDSAGNTYRLTLPMTADSDTNGSYYLSDNLNVIDFSGSIFEQITDDSIDWNAELSRLQKRENGILKVSDVALLYFPAKQTYRIGKGSIIDLSTFSIELSNNLYGRNPLLAFCSDGIWSLEVDTTGELAYKTINPFGDEIICNKGCIKRIDNAVIFGTSKGLMLASSQGTQLFCQQLNGTQKHLPRTDKRLGSGLTIFNNALIHERICNLAEPELLINARDFRDYLTDNATLSYLSSLNALLVWNKEYPYSYLIDIPTQKVSKVAFQPLNAIGDMPDEEFLTQTDRYVFKDEKSINNVVVLQTRPLKLDDGTNLKHISAVVIRGRFAAYYKTGIGENHIELYVLGSLDCLHWQVLGAKSKSLQYQGFDDIGCNTYQTSVKYVMVIITGIMGEDSHIDSLEIY